MQFSGSPFASSVPPPTRLQYLSFIGAEGWKEARESVRGLKAGAASEHSRAGDFSP